jgi:hypothetical protein
VKGGIHFIMSIKQLIEEDEDGFFYLTPMRQDETGLPMIIYPALRCHKRCKPELLILTNHSSSYDAVNSISIPIENLPSLVEGIPQLEFEAVKKFIKLNKKLLVSHWNGNIDSADLCRGIKSV